jgi:porphobilinogen synthase
MLEAAAAQGWIDRERAILETLTVIRRAGADIVLTYWAAEVAGWLAGGHADVLRGHRLGGAS